MNLIKEKYIVNKKGKPVQVVIDINDYEKIMDELEELDCIRVYDEAKKKKEKPIPFSKVISDIENNR